MLTLSLVNQLYDWRLVFGKYFLEIVNNLAYSWFTPAHAVQFPSPLYRDSPPPPAPPFQGLNLSNKALVIIFSQHVLTDQQVGD